MRTYEYRAVGPDGESVAGRFAAASELELDRELEGRGLLLTRVRSTPRKRSAERLRLSRAELIHLASVLATLHRAGVPIVEGLRGLEKRTPAPRLRSLLRAMVGRLEAGARLSEVVESLPRVFPPAFRAAIAAGEASGSLDRVLDRVGGHLEWERSMRSTAAQALVYPAVLLAAIGGLVGILLLHVLPRVVELYPGGATDLPGETRFVLSISDGLSRHRALLAAGVAVGIAVLFAARRSARLRAAFHRVQLAVPVLGGLASKIATARFAATAAVLKSAGCDVSTLLGVAARSAGNAAIEAALARAAVRVEAGHSMSHALEREPLIDPLLVQLVGVGESTGRLDVALDGLAEHYDRDVPRSVKRTLALVEPALLLAAGAVVAFILLAAMLPIFDMYDHLG